MASSLHALFIIILTLLMRILRLKDAKQESKFKWLVSGRQGHV